MDQKNGGFGELKGGIHAIRLTPLSCDKNHLSQEFSELISTV
jgi:hypothetical protein